MNVVKNMLQRTNCLDLGPGLDRQYSNRLRHEVLRSIMGKEQKQTVLWFCLPFQLKTTSVVIISFNRCGRCYPPVLAIYINIYVVFLVQEL